MNHSDKQIKKLYKIAISIGARLDPQAMMETSLTAFLENLNCQTGEIYLYQKAQQDKTIVQKAFFISAPAEAEGDNHTYKLFPDCDSLNEWDMFCQQLPLTRMIDSQQNVYFHLFELPRVGFLVLTKNDAPINPNLVEGLEPLMQKLGTACLSSLQGSEFEQSRHMLQTVLNTVGEGIVTIDSQSTIIMINREVQNVWGYSPEELIGSPIQMLMPEKFRDAHAVGMKNYLKTGVASVLGKRLELQGLHKNGSTFPLEIRIKEARIGEDIFFTAAVRDITERNELERMRENFVSTVSHELRTPLASIMGFLETVLDGRPGPLTDTQTRFLKNSYKNSERLLKLIEELLTISRIQQGNLKLNNGLFSPSGAISNIQEMMMSLASAKSVTLNIENPQINAEKIWADKDRLEQVMINLISNAIKFTPIGGQVDVRHVQTETDWYFEVIDTGIGIPESEIQNLFQRFYRAENATKAQIQGTGLGLYVCRAIIEEHGGEIHLESELGKKTKAWFSVPVSNKVSES